MYGGIGEGGPNWPIPVCVCGDAEACRCGNCALNCVVLALASAACTPVLSTMSFFFFSVVLPRYPRCLGFVEGLLLLAFVVVHGDASSLVITTHSCWLRHLFWLHFFAWILTWQLSRVRRYCYVGVIVTVCLQIGMSIVELGSRMAFLELLLQFSCSSFDPRSQRDHADWLLGVNSSSFQIDAGWRHNGDISSLCFASYIRVRRSKILLHKL